ncbi:MAG: hypothetical protein R3208_03120 [Ketobacteraceae bacterium]|nr:hypothetical protein [Ketobacteraceae bacterium]
MIPRLLELLSLVVLWICSLVAAIALAGMVIAVIPLGWAPLFLYSCIGLWCAWAVYRRTVKPGEKTVSGPLIIQCSFMFLVAVVCFGLGAMDTFGFDPYASQVAALPIVFFLLIALRRTGYSTEPQPGTIENTFFSKLFFTLGYLWFLLALVYVLASMVGTFMIDLFTGVSLMMSPLNPVSWLVILLWFLPAFILLGLGRVSRKVRPY